jgi:predicted GIY-YIG superfamily endonuclease
MYVVECSDHSLYTGITNNLNRRLTQHNAGKGAAYTAARRPVKLLATWIFMDRGTALKAEYAFKQYTRQKKLKLIHAKSPYYDGVFVEIG